MKKYNVLFFYFISFGVFGQIDSTKTKLYQHSVEEILAMPVNAPSYFDQEVSSVSMMQQKSSDAPANLQIITQAQIQERGYHDLSDVLKDLHGIDVSEQAGIYGEYYTIRGINGNDRFLVLVNGRKVNSPSGTHLSVGNSLSVKFLERMEIVYGSASLIYGSDAFSGIINLISKKTPKNNEIRHEIQANYGTFNSFDVSMETRVNVKNKFSLHSFARLYQSDGFSPQLPAFTEMAAQYPAPYPKEISQPIDDHTIFLEAKYKNWRAGYFRQGFSEGFSNSSLPNNFLYRPESVWKLSQNIYWLNYEKQFKTGGILSADLTHFRYLQDPETKNVRFSQIGNPNSPIINQYYAGEDISWKGLLTYSQNFRKLSLVAGVQTEFIQSIPHYANAEVLGSAEKFEGTVEDTIRKVLTIGETKIGVFGQISYTPFEHLTLVGGLRYDNSQLFGSNYVPRISLIFKPFEPTTLKLIYGSAFQNPSIWFQYEQFNSSAIRMVSGASDLGFDLRSQQVNSYELDIIHQLNKKWVLEANVFYNQAFDLIGRRFFSSEVYNPVTQGFTGGIRNENLGEQRVFGMTFKMDYRTEKLNAYLYYTYTDAQIQLQDESWVKLQRVSPHKIWAGVQINTIAKYLEISPRLRWVNAIYAEYGSPIFEDNNLKAKGFTYLNLTVNLVKLIPRTRIFITAENLLHDTEISNVGRYYGSVAQDMAVPQAGRTLRIGLQGNF